jgi:hypothetical protein
MKFRSLGFIKFEPRNIEGQEYHIVKLEPPAHAGSLLADFYTLKMEAIRSSETSDNTISTRRHIPEDGIFQNNNIILQLDSATAHFAHIVRHYLNVKFPG